MDKFQVILNSIDWIFAGVILVGGRYWGTKYFRLSKNDSLNFLGFATAFGFLYLAVIHFTVGIEKNQIANLFITYLIVTSFYELLAQRIFEWLERLMGVKKKEEVVILSSPPDDPKPPKPPGFENPPPPPNP